MKVALLVLAALCCISCTRESKVCTPEIEKLLEEEGYVEHARAKAVKACAEERLSCYSDMEYAEKVESCYSELTH